jgi:hypothetical protein
VEDARIGGKMTCKKKGHDVIGEKEFRYPMYWGVTVRGNVVKESPNK